MEPPVTLAIVIPHATSTICFVHIDNNAERLASTMADLGMGKNFKKHSVQCNLDPVLLRDGIGSFDLPISEYDRRRARTYNREPVPQKLNMFEFGKFTPSTALLRKLLATLANFVRKKSLERGHQNGTTVELLPKDMLTLRDAAISLNNNLSDDDTKDPKASVSSTTPHMAGDFFTQWIFPFLYNCVAGKYECPLSTHKNMNGFYLHLPLHTIESIRLSSTTKCPTEVDFFSSNTFTIEIDLPVSFFVPTSNSIHTIPVDTPAIVIPSIFLDTNHNDNYDHVQIRATFPYKLRETQQDAYDAVMDIYFPQPLSPSQLSPTENSSCSLPTPPATLVQLPCGSGKTILAMRIIYELYVARQLITDAVIFVPTTEILNMWLKELKTVPAITGIVQVTTYQGVSRKSVLARGGVGSSCLNPFWEKTKLFANATHPMPRKTFVIVDEVHHVAAKTFHRVMTTMCPSSILAFSLGLTATMERKDGLKPLVDQVFRNSIAYERYAIEENRTLGSLFVFNLSYALTQDEAEILLDANSHNPHANLATVHAISSQRAKWIVNELLPNYLLSSYKHIMILVSRVKQLITLLNAIDQQKRTDLHYTVSVKCSNHAYCSNPQLPHLLKQVNSRDTDSSLSSSATNKVVTLAVIDKVGEGFNDTSIDCLVFADRAKCPTQNASRLRSSTHGAIVYLVSTLQLNGKRYAASDIKAIERTLFTKINEKKVYSVEIE